MDRMNDEDEDYTLYHQQSSLLKLPNEILEAVIRAASTIERDDECQFLGWQYPEYEYADLKAIALTCRRLYMLCAPYLWRDKEFILPRQDDQKNETAEVQMATDILSKQALFQRLRHLGCYVRSLSRDLTNGPHYDMSNSNLMAQLVCNLRALRIDFHPKVRSEHYGLKFFIQHCPSLSELYLENCRDTYDDFWSLIEYRHPLRSLTLLCCTVKEQTLLQLINLFKPTLKRLLLQKVLIEPDPLHSTKTDSHPLYSHHDVSPKRIPSHIYVHMLSSQNLTRLALSDSIAYSTLEKIVEGSPKLEKLAIILHEMNPVLATRCILLLAKLDCLTILSLAFRHIFPRTNTYQRLPCCAPASAWSYFASHLPSLRLIHISATQLLLHSDFMLRLVTARSHLLHVMLHHIAWVPDDELDITELNDDQIAEAHAKDMATASDRMDAWQQDPCLWQDIQSYFLSYDEAELKGFRCFDETDQVCFVKGFDDWTKGT
ncbi:uncharacterized protein BYT42DRAFT_550558 [Radiomyces spectabilis]|uniref:uncharacterized protein n=1 Tax=Radiomyces spectabilis TaxID=64574 RepID=UPI002220FDBC|nr:uncharacterized protein BYT42DRAFT_550558 [Radiomyces spectabilis]KAI8393296.1 hypothetical protein BYT42DRAFT_550558 [Radiomyces spectabilis]